MAVTSCASAELIAVSSILTFDIFKTYIKPSATPKQLIFVAHVCICIWGVVMAVFAIIWNVIGIDLGWLFLVMGLLIGGAVFRGQFVVPLPTIPCVNFPSTVAFTVIWLKQTKYGAISGAIVGLIAGLTAWLVEAKVYYGELTISTTGSNYPTLAGNIAAIMTGLIVTVSVSLSFPDKTASENWTTTRSINAENRNIAEEKHDPSLATVAAQDAELAAMEAIEEEPRKLKGALKLAIGASFAISFVMDFLVPMPMFFSHYIFSSGFFTGWVVIVSPALSFLPSCLTVTTSP